MKANKAKSHIGILKRICALVLCTAMIIGVMPQMSFNKAEAANTAQSEALNKLVQWGVMRGDQAGNLSPERAITRAEFVTMVNRAFGYTKTGAQPFKDVDIKDWFYDDISTAYNIGYLSGTSKTTASPNDNLTREAAVVILCRNIMLKEKSGEDLSFTDSRTASSWSRGFIKAAAEKGIVSGDPSGTFRPLANITRGEVAILLSRIIGTPAKDEGTYSNNVSGNVMVSTSGVTLDNMIITGDLYITAGVGLGYVTLNNVHVYGQIIVSGAGESNKGDCSIIIKNSSASEMIVDNLSNQYVTVRTMGSTIINKTSVQTNAYLEDKCTSDYGMLYIEVNGEDGTTLDLSGNIKEVVTITPESEINVGSGTVEKMTIDEAATDSTVNISQGAVVEILNLDTATTVNGKGDIGSLYVNAPGCKVEMLPDYIYIRPGITANINGIEMDSTLAQQMSDKPRILTGYPRSDDIGPNQIITKFQTNKSGTIYWAIRLSGDGVMVADDIITPPSYGAKVIKNGNINVNDANTTVEVKTTGLEIDTSYVLSAVFVDSKGDKSPVKTLYFTTPDDSKPAFTSGYPKASSIEDTYVVFDVATSKNCTLYWAIYKKGMTAPTANDFKDNTLSGAIDSGSVKMIKNEDDSITMGNILKDAKDALQELTDYDVYFFLTDSINDSAVTKVSIKTADRTPPKFLTNYPRITKIDAKALTGEGAIDEDGKIYWALVKRGTEYPIINPSLNNPDDILLDQKLQIKGGMYALKSGSVNAKQNVAASINFSGLEAEGAYDIYFVAEDNQGNLSEIVYIKNAKTLDETPPTVVEQKFSQTNSDNIPLADTDITIVFSEDIYSTQTRLSLYEMYNSTESSFPIYGSQTEEISFVDIINNMFTLKNLDISDPNAQNVPLEANEDDFKDFINVELTEEGLTEVTFKNGAFDLKSGAEYQFILNYITDSSNNAMGRNIPVESFRILNAQIDVSQTTTIKVDSDGGEVPVDVAFSLIPFAGSTKNASANSKYDIIIASDTTISFDLYYRQKGINSTSYTAWSKYGNNFQINKEPTEKWTAASWNYVTIPNNDPDLYPYVTDFPNEYEFAIKLTSVNEINEENSDKWNATINLNIFCISGSANDIKNLISATVNNTSFNEAINNQEISIISNPTDFSMKIVRVNQSAPRFTKTYPRVAPGDSTANILFELDREGDLYYVVAPEELLPPNPMISDATPDNDFATVDIGSGTYKYAGVSYSNWDYLLEGERNHNLTSPTTNNIMNPSNYSYANGYRTGVFEDYSGSGVETITVEGLQANKTYYVYFTLKGSYNQPSPVMVYKFTTGEVVSPILEAYSQGSAATYTVKAQSGTVDAKVYWKLFVQTSVTGYPYIFDEAPQWLSTITPPKTGDNKDITTVRQAITQGVFNANYIEDTQLNRAWTEISSPSTGGYELNQNGNNLVSQADSINGQSFNIIDPEKMQPKTNYILIMAAKNAIGGGSGDPVFAVVEDLHVYSDTGPLIVSVNTSSNSGSISKFTGQIQITFDQDLYLKPSTETSPSNETKLYKPRTGDVIAISNGTASYSKQSPNPARDLLMIDVSNMNDGDSITIYPSYWIGTNDVYQGPFCSETGTPRDTITLTLVRTEVITGTGDNEKITYKWNFVIDPKTGSTSETKPLEEQ